MSVVAAAKTTHAMLKFASPVGQHITNPSMRSQHVLCSPTFAVIEHSVKVLDMSQAVTAQSQGVCTEAQAVVTHVKGTLPLKGCVRVTVGYGHFDQGCPVDYWPNFTLVLISAT